MAKTGPKQTLSSSPMHMLSLNCIKKALNIILQSELYGNVLNDQLAEKFLASNGEEQ
jgi:hypothetical protein